MVGRKAYESAICWVQGEEGSTRQQAAEVVLENVPAVFSQEVGAKEMGFVLAMFEVYEVGKER